MKFEVGEKSTQASVSSTTTEMRTRDPSAAAVGGDRLPACATEPFAQFTILTANIRIDF